MSGGFQELQDQGNEEATPKPCPCCGSPAYFRMCEDGGYYIECNNRQCQLTTKIVFACGEDPKPRLLEMWNKRNWSLEHL